MKIGILTFHRATNYGAILQAYALESFVNSLGHETKVVDYLPNGMGLLYAPIIVPTFLKKLKRIVLNIYMLPSLKMRWQKRNMFWKYVERNLPLTSLVTSKLDLPQLDAYIVGSDQVWSVCFTGGVDKYYWGKFERGNAKLISYAGSAAENMDLSFYSNNNYKLLENFDLISVREDELKVYLQKQLPDKKITKVLDPTLMAGVSYFEELVKDEKILDRPYVLVYQVIHLKATLIQEYAQTIAGELDCDIVEIMNSKLNITRAGQKIVLKKLVNPSQFVSLYKHAKYVITTSFHGTAFSLLYNRPFNVISVSPEVDSRAKDLLHQLHIESRMIELPAKINFEEINWETVNNKLEELRKPSRSFLLEALN